MSMVRALRTLTALENGTLTGAQLETQLSGSGARRGEFALLCASSGAAQRMATSSVTMTAVAASATAMAEFVKYPTCRMAAWASDNALNAIKASATAMAALRGAAGYAAVSPGSSSGTFDLGVSGKNYIVLGISNSLYGTGSVTLNTRRSSSAMAATLSPDGSPDSAAQDSNQATPVTGPVLVNQTNGYFWCGLLRCDA